jgi:hypothetical protein
VNKRRVYENVFAQHRGCLSLSKNFTPEIGAGR